MIQEPLGCFFFCHQITISPNHIKGQACLVFAIARTGRVTVSCCLSILVDIILIELGLSFITSKTTVMITNRETCLLHRFDEFDQLSLGCWIFPRIIVFRQRIMFISYDDFIVFPLNTIVVSLIDNFCLFLTRCLRFATYSSFRLTALLRLLSIFFNFRFFLRTSCKSQC
ncbi:Uncharacterised protein [Streptococcus pneumoniae]|nr:Uncharacterised protein [Streptococcus pneumoniae]